VVAILRFSPTTRSFLLRLIRTRFRSRRYHRGGRLKPFFLAITDGVSKGRRDISNGFRATVEARLRNEAFLYSRDLSAKPRTAKITFASSLGASLKPLRCNVRRRLENVKKLGF